MIMNVTKMREPGWVRVRVQGGECYANLSTTGGMEAVNKLLEDVADSFDPDEGGYPVLRVYFGCSTPLAIVAAATVYGVGGVVRIDEPVWERLWYCPPHQQALERFLIAASRGGGQTAY